jgi:hypothetical protein
MSISKRNCDYLIEAVKRAVSYDSDIFKLSKAYLLDSNTFEVVIKGQGYRLVENLRINITNEIGDEYKLALLDRSPIIIVTIIKNPRRIPDPRAGRDVKPDCIIC